MRYSKFVVIEQSHDPHPYNTIIYSTSFVKHILLLRIIFFKSFHNQFSIRSTKAKSTTHIYATQLFIPLLLHRSNHFTIISLMIKNSYLPDPNQQSRSAAVTKLSVRSVLLIGPRTRATLMRPWSWRSSLESMSHLASFITKGGGGKKRMGDRFLIDAPNYTGCTRVFRS